MDENLLIKFISSEATIEEQQEVLAWIEKDKKNKKVFAQLKNLSVVTETVASERHLPASQRIKKIYSWSTRIAAILVIAFSFYLFGKNDEKHTWENNSKEQITEISVPYGETVTLLLPDGTNVRLNSGSVLKYSGLYGYKKREVYLNGEGFFNVKKDEKHFIVKTSNLNIEVRGTVFNISAYKEDRLISASLYSGKVLVNNFSNSENVILKPNTTYVFDKVTEKSNIREISSNNNWTENYFIADCDDIEFFVKKIERKYSVKIHFDHSLKGKCLYTGTFKGETLDEILKNMALASPIKYQIKNSNTVIISPK